MEHVERLGRRPSEERDQDRVGRVQLVGVARQESGCWELVVEHHGLRPERVWEGAQEVVQRRERNVGTLEGLG